MSIRKKIARGAFWSFVERGGQQALSFLIFTVLARFVGPKEFGLINLCYVFMAFTNFVLLSVPDGIISLRIRDKKLLSTLFWALMGAGLLLCLLGCFVVIPYSDLIGEPRLIPLMRLISLIALLQALSAVPTFLVLAEMDFRIFTIRTLLATVLSGIVGVTLAVLGYGAFALAIQQIIYYATINLVLWIHSAWRPSFTFERKKLAALILPGLKMTGSSFISFLEQQAPRLLVGNFQGPTSVGYFSFCSNILFSLQEILVGPFAMGLFPAFAELKDDPDEQRKIMGEIVRLTGFVVFPTIVGAIVTAPLYVPLFFGDAWIPAVPVLQALLLSGMTAPFLIITRDFLRALNKTEAYLKLQFVIVAFEIALFVLLVPYGLVAMALGLVAVSALALPSLVFMISRWTSFRLFHDYVRLLPSLLSAGLMGAAIALTSRASFFPESNPLRLASLIMEGIGIYALCSLLFQYKDMRQLYTVVMPFLRRKSVRP